MQIVRSNSASSASSSSSVSNPALLIGGGGTQDCCQQPDSSRLRNLSLANCQQSSLQQQTSDYYSTIAYENSVGFSNYSNTLCRTRNQQQQQPQQTTIGNNSGCSQQRLSMPVLSPVVGSGFESTAKQRPVVTVSLFFPTLFKITCYVRFVGSS